MIHHRLHPARSRLLFIVLSFMLLLLMTPSLALAQEGETAPINGVDIYYTVQGEGPPLILIHGGLGNSDYWENQIPVLAEEYTVIAMDSRGHGRSTFDDTPIGYDLMMSDVIGLMDYLEIEKADILGWSDGGIIGLDMAINYPDRVNKIIAYGANYDPSGVREDIEENETFNAYVEKAIEDYQALSPEPEKWDAFLENIGNMWATEPNFTPAQLRAITTPILILDGEFDEAIKTEHTREMARLIPTAELVLIPDTGHFAMWERPEEFNRIVLEYLDSPTASFTSKSNLPGFWGLYEDIFKNAKYIDLTHAFEPVQPVWPGFGNAKFKPAVAGQDIEDYVKKGEEYTYEDHGFVATAYEIPTDQYGTQLDPPAHWDEYGATISDLPATYAIRPLVVINIADKVAEDIGYHLQVEDILDWEAEYGRIPAGSVVMVRSDFYKLWDETERFGQAPFPGVSLDALKFLHLERNILFHGHEPLDTDTTPTLEGEYWLMHNQFAQAEGVANLDKVPEAGGLILIGFAKPLGGTGGYARYIAIAPSDWPYGVSVTEAPGAPLPKQPYPLKRDENGVMRPTKP